MLAGIKVKWQSSVQSLTAVLTRKLTHYSAQALKKLFADQVVMCTHSKGKGQKEVNILFTIDNFESS